MVAKYEIKKFNRSKFSKQNELFLKKNPSERIRKRGWKTPSK